MSSSRDGGRYLDVDGLRFEAESGDLTAADGRTTRLAPQPARLLTLLAEEPGRLVTREAIAEELWPHGSVEIDQGIGYAVREVRKAIESVGGDPDAIETIPRRGFRVRTAPPVAAAPEPGSVPPAGTRARPAGPRSVGVLVTLAALAVGTWLGMSLAAPPESATPALAVFEHEAEEAGARAFAAALGTTLTTRLTQDFAGRLGVVGPTGTGGLSGPDDTEGVRAELGGCLILSGGVRPAADSSFAVFTQIVRASDRVHVWASTDTVDMSGALDQVASRVLVGVERVLTDCGG